MKKEIWRCVIGYENKYQVSNMGRVKRCTTTISNGRGTYQIEEKIIGSVAAGDGYKRFIASKNGVKKIMVLHIEIAKSFLGHIPCGHKVIVDHKDENKLNNHLYNLQLITFRENITRSIDKTKTSSKHTGVTFRANKKNKWESSIGIGLKRIHLGLFNNEEHASKIYQIALLNLDKYDGDSKMFRDFIKQQIPTTPGR